MSFPGATPSYQGFTSSHTLATDNHAAQHNQEQTDIIALANKIGTGASTPTSGLLLRGSGAGTSAWGQAVLTTDVTGVLPQANGGTGTTLATGTGKAVYDTSPLLTTPTIASFVNANHSHQNAAGGGTLSAGAISSIDLSNTTLSNPFNFSAYHSSTQVITTAGGTVSFDSEEYDTNNNFSSNSYTVPLNGFYDFNFQTGWAATSSQTECIANLQVGGVTVKVLGDIQTGQTVAGAGGIQGRASLHLSAGQVVTISFTPVGANTTLRAGPTYTYFQGSLRSTT